MFWSPGPGDANFYTGGRRILGMVRRSVLFTPGDRRELHRKAIKTGADVVVLDLEDGVGPNAKDEARDTVRETLESRDPGCEVCLRVNATPEVAAADLDGVLGPGTKPDSVMLPKTGSASAVEILADQLRKHGADLPILALVESAAGVLHAEGIASAKPTDALLFGAEDLAGDIGALRTDEGTEVLAARSQVVLAASAAGIDAIDTHYPDYEDLDGLGEDAEFALELGYDGKMALHPDQVRVINDAFTPPADRITWARRILAATSDAPEKAVFVLDGEMIDAPQIRQAERIRARARAGNAWGN
jgi:citrate lyase subunit beta/citryl-CoA lyase